MKLRQAINSAIRRAKELDIVVFVTQQINGNPKGYGISEEPLQDVKVVQVVNPDGSMER